MVATAWQRKGDTLILAVRIPANTTAEVWLPMFGASGQTESGVTAGAAEGVTVLFGSDAGTLLRVGSGVYRFEVRPQ